MAADATTTGGERWRALVIEHERPTPPGLVEPWLRDRGAEPEILRIDEEDPHDLDPGDYGLIVSLGSEFGAYQDDIEWIGHEIDFVRDALEKDVPFLGICFGGQLLARAMGGRVFRSDEEEIGWLPVGTKDPDLVPDGPWFQWHFDSFEVPPGSQVIAENAVGPQAYLLGRSLGLQFHPEVTTEIMDDWVRVYRHELDEHGVDPDALLEETHARADENRATSLKLLDAYLDRIVRPRERT
ncbi:MAG TPA: type 1 glutamine amidotransferase [Gaiellaceae bacterium]